tara:strand:- start:236 stop:886 length:651 start_codon:yes stop_codon:yes gene_type:complete
MKNILCIFIIFQIFYIARAESSIGLKLGNSFNKSRTLTYTDTFRTGGEDFFGEYKLDGFFSMPYGELFLNLYGHQVSIGYGWGFQSVAYPSEHPAAEEGGRHSGFKEYISYQNTRILNNLLLPSNLKNIISLSPIITLFLQEKFFYLVDDLDDIEDNFISGFEIGASAHYLKFGKYKPYITFSLPLSNKNNESWSFHIGLDINIPLGAESKDFEDF